MSLFLDLCGSSDPAGLRAWTGEQIARFLPVLGTRINSLADDKLVQAVRVAAPEGCFAMIAGHHFHSTPEVFIQLSGATEFSFPAAGDRLQSDQILFLPAGLPHQERILGRKPAFANLVMMFERDRLTVHIAFANRQGNPQGTHAVHWKSPQVGRLVDLIDHLSAAGELGLPVPALAGLIRVFFSTVTSIIGANPVQPRRYSPRIAQCVHLIRTHVADPDLSVSWLAEELNCSADYLSHRFAAETGERISRFVNRQRVQTATSLLHESTLTVEQIAHAVGFRHPGYFIRVYRSLHGTSPGQTRRA